MARIVGTTLAGALHEPRAYRGATDGIGTRGYPLSARSGRHPRVRAQRRFRRPPSRAADFDLQRAPRDGAWRLSRERGGGFAHSGAAARNDYASRQAEDRRGDDPVWMVRSGLTAK